MLADARDFFIIMWVVFQATSWTMPDAYGEFRAMEEKAYLQTMEKLGVWNE